jgi:hypothetical protein
MISDQSLSSEEANALGEELGKLTRQQYTALQKSSYLHMTEEEAYEYDNRRLRIGEICEFLAKFRSK